MGVLFLIPDLKKPCHRFRKFLGLNLDYVGTYRESGVRQNILSLRTKCKILANLQPVYEDEMLF